MQLATSPSNKRHRRGLATLRRLKQDIVSAFSKHLPATLNFTYSRSGSSIYTERLLSGNQIRILRVQPSSDPRKRLECELELVNLDDAPAYEALSYVWGVDPPSVSILCNNQRLRIRPELSYALARLRLKHTTRIIWADALCINQNDKKEKSHQVPLMGRVFSQATKVNVWLGRGDEDVIKEAFKCSRLIADACREFGLEHNVDPDDLETHAVVEIPTSIFTPTACRSLGDLCNRPLFSRVWCIQEVGLAQDALVVWGEKELPWADIGLAASWIFNKRNGSHVNENLQSMLRRIDVGDVDTMYELDRFEASLLDTLSDFRGFHSTDPRDKVYGLISLVGSRAEVDALMPDYEKTVAQVFADTLTCTLGLTGHLDALKYIQHHGEYDGDNQYRSWAPRWDQQQITSIIDASWTGTSNNACGERIAGPLAMYDSERMQLRLTGVVYDTTSVVSNVLGDPNFERLDETSEHNPVLEVYEKIGLSDGDRDEKLRAVARTFTTRRYDLGAPIRQLDGEALSNFYKGFEDFIEWLRAPLVELDGLNDTSLRYQRVATLCCRMRRFFWTSEGDFGLGPECMRAGDIVVVLYGGETPYVLRPKGDQYIFLGETYVDSILQGELVKEVEEGKRQEQEFCLI